MLAAERGVRVKVSVATLWAIAIAVPEHLFMEFLSPSPPLVCPASPSSSLPPLLLVLQTLLKLSVTKQ